jgi:hypothetical protein
MFRIETVTSLKQNGRSVVLKLKRCVHTYNLKLLRRLNLTKPLRPSSRIRRWKGEKTDVLRTVSVLINVGSQTLIGSRTTMSQVFGHGRVCVCVCVRWTDILAIHSLMTTTDMVLKTLVCSPLNNLTPLLSRETFVVFKLVLLKL